MTSPGLVPSDRPTCRGQGGKFRELEKVAMSGFSHKENTNYFHRRASSKKCVYTIFSRQQLTSLVISEEPVLKAFLG